MYFSRTISLELSRKAVSRFIWHILAFFRKPKKIRKEKTYILFAAKFHVFISRLQKHHFRREVKNFSPSVGKMHAVWDATIFIGSKFKFARNEKKRNVSWNKVTIFQISDDIELIINYDGLPISSLKMKTKWKYFFCISLNGIVVSTA